uniref:MIP34701p1 n=1 Tax=Drosophila melanogaster TaxID=7227 RepID=I7FW78_DROME|nr:MIP34701p1 [Drosophila melanogaster]
MGMAMRTTWPSALACPDLFGLPCWFCPGPGSHASFTLLSVAISFDALWTRLPPPALRWPLAIPTGIVMWEWQSLPAQRHNPGRHCGVKWAVCAE